MLDNKIKLKKRGKRAQVGETMTWILATIVLVVLLLTFIYATSILADFKKVVNYKAQEVEIKSISDLIVTKTSLAYLINDNNKNKINGWIKENEK